MIAPHFFQRCFVALIALMFFAPCSAAENITNDDVPAIMVMADPSLTVPLTHLSRRYSQSHKMTITTSFGATKTQAQMIEDGAPADIFITARLHWMDELRTKGLIDVYSQTMLARNRLVLVGPENSTFKGPLCKECRLGGKLRLLEGDELMLALGDPEYLPEGSFAMEMLTRQRMMRELEPFLAFFRDPLEITRMVSKRRAYAITFASDAMLGEKSKTLAEFPEAMHPPIIYRAAVVAGENMTPARGFLEYLKSEEAKEVFKKSGFL